MFHKILPTPCQNTSIDTDLGRCRIIELPLFAPGKDHFIVLTKRDKAFTIVPQSLIECTQSYNFSPLKAQTRTPRDPRQKGKDEAPISSKVENQYNFIVYALWSR